MYMHTCVQGCQMIFKLYTKMVNMYPNKSLKLFLHTQKSLFKNVQHLFLWQICLLPLSSTLFPIIINDLLCQPSNPIYSFADKSILCDSYSSNHRPSIWNVGAMRKNMKDTLNRDLDLISEWVVQIG